MDEKKLLEGINSKLSILIALQMIEKKPDALREKIKLLDNLGAETKEIASILGKNKGFIAKEKSVLKKKNAKEN